jgi:hypothetical protein
VNGLPLRFQICNPNGECVFVKPSRPLMVEGVVLSVMSEDVSDLCDAITAADDELQEEETPWEDNFNLTKLRAKKQVSKESS